LYPLTIEEIIKYCNFQKLNTNEVFNVLEELQNKSVIGYFNGFYFLGNDISKIKRRLDGNILANKRIATARKYSTLISNFPFVRAIFISGSLSKNFMLPDSDIDFFIVAEPGKLWLCKAILILFKKLFLFNSYRNFCLNYFVDSSNLEIPDKNIYTANEIVFLIPIYNYLLYKQFMATNIWVKTYYPNIEVRSEIYIVKPFRAKQFFEMLFNNRIGKLFDDLSLNIFTKFWRRKFNYFDDETFSIRLRSKKNVSKHHPNDFQEKVLKVYGERINELEKLLKFWYK
jgi:hypothetical protein